MGALNESEKPSQINVYLQQKPPFSAFNAAQDAQGILVDYWQQWSSATGITVKFHSNLNVINSSNIDQPVVYSGLPKKAEELSNLKKYPLFAINSHFYYLSPHANELTQALINKNKPLVVGGLLANAQQLPFFSAHKNISYQEYPGALELLIAIFNDQIDALVVFEGKKEKANLWTWGLSLLFEEKLIKRSENTLSIYVPEKQAAITEWISWGNQFDKVSHEINLAINKAANPILGTSSNMLVKILAISGGLFLFYIFNLSKRKKDRQFKSLLDDSPYPLVILSLDGSTIYYLNDEVQLLFATKKENNEYFFEAFENQTLLSDFVNKASHKIAIEAEQIRLLVGNRFHDIEISAKRVYYQRKTAWLCYLKDIDALLQAKQKLTEERELLRKVLDSIPEQIFFKSPKGSIIGCNDSWAKANNTSVMNATGKRLSDVISVDLINKQKQQESVVWAGGKFNVQEWQQQQNNEMSLINTVKVPLYNDKGGVFAILSIERDVTDLYNLNKKLVDENLQRKKTEVALSKQNILLSTVFAASIDPIGLLDREGRVIDANNAFAVLLGKTTSADVIGYLQSEFLSQEGGDWAAHQNQQVIESGNPLIFEKLIFIDGKKICYEVCKTPFKDDQSGYQGIVITARDITLHKQTEEKLSLDASNFEVKMLHDQLTGIANRRFFDLQFEKLWQEAGEEQQLLSLLMCDIDFFKYYNDNYGHQKGDQALQKVALALQSVCEKCGCFVARYGGEEFVVLIKGGNATKALKVAEALRQSVAQAEIEHLYSSASLIVTLSMGLSNMEPNELNSKSMLLAEADSAMFEAKKNGRDQICVH